MLLECLNPDWPRVNFCGVLIGRTRRVISKACRLFEIWSDWLKVRVRVALIGLGSGSGLV